MLTVKNTSKKVPETIKFNSVFILRDENELDNQDQEKSSGRSRGGQSKKIKKKPKQTVHLICLYDKFYITLKQSQD